MKVYPYGQVGPETVLAIHAEGGGGDNKFCDKFLHNSHIEVLAILKRGHKKFTLFKRGRHEKF